MNPPTLVDRIVDKHKIDEVEGPLRALVEAARVLGRLDTETLLIIVEHLGNRINRTPRFVADALKRHTPDLNRIAGRYPVHGLAR